MLAIRFLDAANEVIDTAAIGPVTNADRNSQTGLLLRQETGFVPSGTRSIGVELQMTRLNGTYNDGYADNLSLVLHAPLPLRRSTFSNGSTSILKTLAKAKLRAAYLRTTAMGSMRPRVSKRVARI